MMLGKTACNKLSTTQAIIALSPGEAEYYALLKVGSEGLGMHGVMREFGVSVSLHLVTDSSTAKCIASRRGWERRGI